MCVIVAVKLPRNRKTGKPLPTATWRLAKIRDRAYDPEYKIRRYTVKSIGASQLFLIDADTDWTEGISVHPDGSMFMMVNAALNNSSDKKEGTNKSNTSSHDDVSVNGLAIRKALKDHSIEKAKDILIQYKFDGNTFLSDGKRLFVIEMFVSNEVKDKYRAEKLRTKKRFEDIVPIEEFTITTKEVKDDWIVARTNSGIYNTNGGYVPSDDDNYKSSKKRRDHTINAVKENVYEPIDLIDVLAKLDSKEIDVDPWYRPIRIKEKEPKDKNGLNIYTTSIIQIDPNGTMVLQPVNCKLKDYNINKLSNKKYLTNLVLFPEKKKIFETFISYYARHMLLK